MAVIILFKQANHLKFAEIPRLLNSFQNLALEVTRRLFQAKGQQNKTLEYPAAGATTGLLKI
jgi:hypothetical protein